MTLEEFVERTDYQPDDDEWWIILKYYREFDGDTDEFCRVYNFGRYARQLPRNMKIELMHALWERGVFLNNHSKDSELKLVEKMFFAI